MFKALFVASFQLGAASSQRSAGELRHFLPPQYPGLEMFKGSEYCAEILQLRIGELKRRHLITRRVHEMAHGLSPSVLLVNDTLELRIAAVRLSLRILHIPVLVLLRPIVEPLPGHGDAGGPAKS